MNKRGKKMPELTLFRKDTHEVSTIKCEDFEFDDLPYEHTLKIYLSNSRFIYENLDNYERIDLCYVESE